MFYQILFVINVTNLETRGMAIWQTAAIEVGQSEVVTSNGILCWRREVHEPFGSMHFSLGTGSPYVNDSVNDWIAVRLDEPDLDNHHSVIGSGGA